MDAIDKKILYHLDLNGREQASSIAKRIGQSKQVVQYRINNFFSQKTIKSAQTIINLQRLGKPVWMHLYFKLPATTKEQEIINYLQENKKVGYVATLGGKYDLSIVIIGESIFSCESTIQEIVQTYPNELKNYTTSLRTQGWILPRSYLYPQVKKERIAKPVLTPTTIEKNIDEFDKNILTKIANNARTPINQVAKELKKPFSSVRVRLKKLEEIEIISGYSIFLNLKKINIHNYKLFLKLNNKSEPIIQKIKSYAEKQENVTYVMKTLGTFDIELRIEVKDQEQYQELLRDIRKEFQEQILDTESLIIFEEFKEDFSTVV